ncbi:MAG TPA: HAMP domain-containing sensor histidine kinase [Gaiellaceae bacterium]|nr:HAMP domain-containing sensor histidine kinase [Gaiellaceae bacterium]
MRKPPLLSLSVKVGLILFVVVAGALAIVYAAVVPQLESRVVDAKLDELRRSAPTVARTIGDQPAVSVQQVAAETLGESLDVRIVLLSRLTEGQLVILADSRRIETGDLSQNALALRTMETRSAAAGRTSREGGDFAEAAYPLEDGTVILLSAPLGDALANVRLVRRSLLVAGAVALVISWFVGYLVAWSFTRRIRRLEGAAERLADGDFETPVVDTGRDEIAQLADAFDAMRERLAVLDRARGEFIANASHELRTPLFSLGGFAELLADEDMDPAVRRDFLVEMRGQIERLTRLATDLLDLSRLDAGQLHVEEAPFDLAASARLVADEFRAIADAEDHELRVDAAAPVQALGDEQRVQQIARALLENALRHTPPGTPVDVAVEHRDGCAALEVRDAGPGIPADEQGHVFQRFYRAAGGKASGSGLGLAIARELAVRMGGSIRLESRPGDTVFTLTLPLAGEPAFSREAPPEAPEPVAGPSK